MLLYPISRTICPPSSDNQGWKYTQPETGVVFRSMALNVLWKMVKKHREAMKIPMPHNAEHIFWDDLCRQGGYECEPNPLAEGYESPFIIQAHERWKELHEYSRSVPEIPTPEEQGFMQSWFSQWTQRVPTFSGCRCQEHLLQTLASRSPNYSSRDAFFAFCVDLHSDISERIGKPRWKVTGNLECGPA
jgi:hypothetical protein